jgi:hypothetical protein
MNPEQLRNLMRAQAAQVGMPFDDDDDPLDSLPFSSVAEQRWFQLYLWLRAGHPVLHYPPVSRHGR